MDRKIRLISPWESLNYCKKTVFSYIPNTLRKLISVEKHSDTVVEKGL